MPRISERSILDGHIVDYADLLNKSHFPMENVAHSHIFRRKNEIEM